MGLDLTLINKNSDYWTELKKYLLNKDFDIDKIKSAYDFAFKAHENQFRESGEIYISHPVWIAKIAAQLGIGQEAIMCALLHDCVEDTPITLDQIASEFGDEIALLVEGLTEVKKKTKGIVVNETNIDVFRKFLFSSVDDVRVLIIRLIDKLHNGITINFLSPERQVRYAKNVMGIYGPIAEYVGLHYFKKRLEDVAFRILNSEEAKKLENKLIEKSDDEVKALAMVRETILKMMEINNIKNPTVEGRIKSLYSTFLKTKRKGEDRVRDRVGVRILTESVADCYTVLGLLHSKYPYLADEFDDYISSPKPNGYRSIQTTLNWKDKLTVEVQIKTKEMHEFNEFGPASHIAYKLGKGISTGTGYEWVKDLIKWQINDKQINNYRIKVLTNYIYVFTPKGDTIQMVKGSTALDFAYRIHTEVGDHCSGVKINKKMAKIDTVLQNGDFVEILLNKKLNVNKNWLDVVKTSWAKEHIRKMVSN